MKPFHKNVVTTAAVLAAAASLSLSQSPSQTQAQTQPPAAQPGNRSVVVLDPAHGGPDAGAKLGDRLLEKDVTLALAARLRAALTTAGFTVISTRQTDALDPLTADQRAEIANRTHAIACLVIHATGTGSGVHLYASTLAPKEPTDAANDTVDFRPAFEPTPWETAQAESVTQSLQLEGSLGAALKTAAIPVVTGRAEVRPLDNMMCPAVAVEVAPLAVAGEDATPVTNPDYQQRMADTLAQALQQWRSHANASTAPAGAALPGGTQ